jgi:hypothetical protein
MQNNKLITRPKCGHEQLTADCVYCLAHHMDTLRHVQTLLRKHLASRPSYVINVIPGRVKPTGRKR